jgi:hypothetical protein
MKIAFGFEDKIWGTVAAEPDGSFAYEGNDAFLRQVIVFWETHGHAGEELLNTMAERLRGRTWAKCVPDDWQFLTEEAA